MTRQVKLRSLQIYGHHGVLAAETALGQDFLVDLCADVDFADAARADDVARTLNYAELAALVQDISDAGPYQLIETFADRIAGAVLDRFARVSRVEVEVRKPNAPIPAQFDYAAVRVVRDRMYPITLSLGANMGDGMAALGQAVLWLELTQGLEITKVSSAYETPPWGKTDQPNFTNACVSGATTLGPLALLRVAKEIEHKLGRAMGARWGPRPIDIDILTFGEVSCETRALTVPHRHMLERAFVLVPLTEIEPTLLVNGRTVESWAQAVDHHGITRLGPL